MKKVILSLIAASMLLTGCNGAILGTDIIESANYGAAGGVNIVPSINKTTTVYRLCDTFVQNILNGDYTSAFNMLSIADTTFVSADDFREWVSTIGLTDEYSLVESSGLTTKVVTLTTTEGSVPLTMLAQESGGFLLLIDTFTTKDFEITVPTGVKLTIDDVDVSEYKQTSESSSEDIYVIPEISNSPHRLSLQTVFSTPLTMDISSTSSNINVLDYMTVSDPLRSQVREIASNFLLSVNDTIIEQDWEKFSEYFAPGIVASTYSTDFNTGHTIKSTAYELELIEVRDLEQSAMDVCYTGYNTIKATFGTRWSWYAKGDGYEIDSDSGKVTLHSKSEMRMVNTVELYYDGTNWSIYAIDSESLARLTSGLEQWR